MFLSQVFDALTYGELSNLALGGLEFSGVKPEHYPKLITNINSGVIELHKRFPLSTKKVTLNLLDHITTYTISTEYLVSNTNSSQPDKYLSDTEFRPFTDGVLLIDGVTGTDGTVYPINNADSEDSVYVPQYNLIQVPFAATGTVLNISYRATPNKISLNPVDPSTVEVPIPDSMLECLVAYVSSKILASGPVEGNQAGMYYNKFIDTCNMLEQYGLVQEETETNTKLDDAGWV